jgi:hypothetical protein
MIVRLDTEELRRAATDGVNRRVNALARRRNGAHGFDRDYEAWSLDIEGVCAEYAVAKALGRYLDPAVTHLDTRNGDVGKAQVRSTRYDNGHLLLHETDDPADYFVLVTGAGGTYTIRGWIKGADGMRRDWWEERGGRWAFFVPQSALQPMNERKP